MTMQKNQALRIAQNTRRLAVLFAITSGVLLAFSYSLTPLWWTAWIAPAPAITAVLIASNPWRFWLGVLAGAMSGVSTFSYHVTTTGIIASVIILLAIALLWGSALRYAAYSNERWSAPVAVLTLPCILSGLDTLLNQFSPHGSASSFAYSQMEFLPLIQSASWGGTPAITFVVLTAGSFMGLTLAKLIGADVRNLKQAGVMALFIVGGALVFGILRLQSSTTTSMTNVSIIATDGISQRPQSWDGFWDIYGESIANSAKPGSIVILPEAILNLTVDDAEKAGFVLAEATLQSKSTIIVGIVIEDKEKITNRALIAKPDGSFEWYLKQHLVPGIEAEISSGDIPYVTAKPGDPFGVAICKDMHFPTLARAYANLDAKLMIVPANDFNVDDWMTSRMTVLRGIESGFSIARSARNGISFVSDPYGRVLSERRSAKDLFTLETEVPEGLSHRTIYAVIGDLFGWLCVVGWGILLISRRRAFFQT